MKKHESLKDWVLYEYSNLPHICRRDELPINATARHLLAVAEEKSTDVVMHCFVDGKEPERWVKLSDLRNYIHGKQEA